MGAITTLKHITLRFMARNQRTLDEDVVRHGDLRHSFVGSKVGQSPAWELFCVLIKKRRVRKSGAWPHIVWGPDVYGSDYKQGKGYFFRADVEVVFGSELALKKGGFDSKSYLFDLHLSCLEETVYLRPSSSLRMKCAGPTKMLRNSYLHKLENQLHEDFELEILIQGQYKFNFSFQFSK